MKKFFLSMIITALLTVPCVAFAENTAKIKVNDILLESDQSPIIYNDRTMVPFRAVFNAIGAEVGWNNNSKTAVAVKDGNIMSITINDNTLYKNGTPVLIDAPAIIVNDRTLVPLRAVSEALNCDVEWDADTRTVSVTADIKQHNPVLVSFLENEFEKTEFQIQGDFTYTIENDTAWYSTKNKINSYAFFDLDSDGEEELVVSSTPEKISPALTGWEESRTVCLSVWDCDSTNKAVNALAKLTLNHRMSNRYLIGVYNNELCLYEIYSYNSSGVKFEERRVYKYVNGVFDKTKEIIFKEFYDNINKDEYDRLVSGEDADVEGVTKRTVVETIQTNGIPYVITACNTSYSIDGVNADRAAAQQALNDFDTGSTFVFSPYHINE